LSARRAAAWVLAAQAAFVAVLYVPVTLRAQFLSDDWVIVERASHSFWAAVTTALGYHYIPVLGAYLHILWRIFGTHAWGYHAAIVLMHLAVGHGVFRLGRRWLGDTAAAAAASFLFLGSASFHEATFWTVASTAYPLVTIFFLAGLREAALMAETEVTTARCLRLALAFLLAIFTYPAAVTLAPLALGVVAWGRWRQEDMAPRRGAWRDLARVAAALAIAMVPVVLARRHYASAISSAQSVRVDMDRTYWMVRGIISTFSLRGSHQTLDAILTLGVPPGPAGVYPAVCRWLAAAAGLLIFVVVRYRRTPLPILALWIAIHFVLAGMTVTVVSRLTYLPAVPATLLIAAALAALGRRMASGRAWWLRYAPLAAGTLLLLWNAAPDRRTAAEIWGKASDASGHAVADLRTALAGRAGSTHVVLLNLPRTFASRGMGAFVFANGTHQMLAMSFGSQVHLSLGVVGEVPVDTTAFGSKPLSLADLTARRDPPLLVLWFDPVALRLRPLPVPTDRYTAETAPYLGWAHDEAAAGLLVTRASPLSLPLLRSSPSTWVAVQYMRKPDAPFALEVSSGPSVTVASAGLPAQAATGTWPLSEGAGDPVTLTIVPEDRLTLQQVWSFAPRTRYDPENAPFLGWRADPSGDRRLVIDSELRLPLDTGGRDDAAVRVAYWAKAGRKLLVRVGGGEPVPLPASDRPGWRASDVPLHGERVVTLVGAGLRPSLVRGLEVVFTAPARHPPLR
jgi:hypothetical protein